MPTNSLLPEKNPLQTELEELLGIQEDVAERILVANDTPDRRDAGRRMRQALAHLPAGTIIREKVITRAWGLDPKNLDQMLCLQ